MQKAPSQFIILCTIVQTFADIILNALAWKNGFVFWLKFKIVHWVNKKIFVVGAANGKIVHYVFHFLTHVCEFGTLSNGFVSNITSWIGMSQLCHLHWLSEKWSAAYLVTPKNFLCIFWVVYEIRYLLCHFVGNTINVTSVMECPHSLIIFFRISCWQSHK